MVRFSRTTTALAFTAAAVLSVAQRTRAQTIVAGPTSTQIATRVGDRVEVPVLVDMTGATGISLGAYRLDFRWNPAVLSFAGAGNGEFGAPAFNTDSIATGLVRFAGANASGATGVVSLGSITLQVLNDSAVSNLTAQFQELTAATTFNDLLPFLIETSLQFCTGRYLGDLDEDGLIQGFDANLVQSHAVGIAIPTDTTAGDVDGDGKVDTRDALIILSFAAQIDVSQFLVGRFWSGICPAGIPGSVTIQPASLSLATDDVFDADAEVRDTLGVLIGGQNVVWSSSDPALATVDATGAVTAVSIGSATLMVAVAPGVTNTAPITVAERHRWFVNPNVAQGQDREIGSNVHPFSKIADAIARAATDDTIAIGVATYNEPLTTAKRLVFEGDSGATGMPIISTPNATAGAITVTGRQVIQRLEIAESQSGLSIRADTVAVTSLAVRSVRGRGLEIVGADVVGLGGVSVNGAVGAGIFIDSSAVISVTGSRIAGVGEAIGSIVPDVFAVGIFARVVGVLRSVSIDSTTIQGIEGQGIHVSGAVTALVRRSSISVTSQSGIAADSSVVTLEVTDSSRVQNVGSNGILAKGVDTIRVTGGVSIGPVRSTGVLAEGFNRLEVADAAFSQSDFGVFGDLGKVADVRRSSFNSIGSTAVQLGADTTVTIDSITVDGAGFAGVVLDPPLVATVDHSTFLNVGYGVFSAIDTVSRARYIAISNSVVRGASFDGIHLHSVDSALVQDDTLEEISGSGVVREFDPAVWVKVQGGRITKTGFNGIFIDSTTRAEIVGVQIDSTGGFAGVFLIDVDTALVRGNNMVDNSGAAVYVQYFAANGVATVDSNSFRGRDWGVRAFGPDTVTGRLVVRGNSFGGFAPRQIGMGPLRTMIVENNTLDSAFGDGIVVGPGDTITVRNDTLTNLFGTGIRASGGAVALFENNSITCADENNDFGIQYHGGGGSILNNTVSKCLFGGFSHNGLASLGVSFDLVIRGNSFARAGALNAPVLGYQMQNGLYRAEVVGNTVTGVAGVFGGIALLGGSAGPILAARVDSNTVQSGGGFGLKLRNIDTLLVDSNTITGFDSVGVGASTRAGIFLQDIFVSAKVVRNRITGNVVPGIRVQGTATGVLIDTNLIADNTGSGIVLLSPASGTLNTIRRNVPYGIDASSGAFGSVFQSNNIEGNQFGVRNTGFSALDFTNGWWGDTLGPRCVTGCDATSVGDSVSANVTFLPFAVDTIVGAPVGAPLALVAAAPVFDRGRRAREALISSDTLPEPRTAIGRGGGAASTGAVGAPEVAAGRAEWEASRNRWLREHRQRPPRPERRP